MIQAKCIQKFRDKQNKIYGYRLIDLNNQTQDVTPENLKKAIINKKIHVINLKLTSDGRLIDTNEKQLQSKELGAKPLTEESNKKRIEEVIANKLVKAVKGNYAKCEIQKGLSNSYNGIIDEYFETNIKYKEHKDVILGIFIDEENLFMSLNNVNIDTIKEWNIKIPNGYQKHIKDIEEFIIDCANSIKSINAENIEISELAKAFTLVDWSLIDMGDCYEEVVEHLCIEAGIHDEVWGVEENELSHISNKAYQKLIDADISNEFNGNYIINHIKEILSKEYLYHNIKDYMYHENVNKLNNSKMYKAISLIYKYFCEKDKKLAKQIKEKLLDDMKQNGIASIKVGYEVGHEYFRYLDSEIFGTLSNNVFTVGHAITTDEKKNFKELKSYSYICSKDYNKLSPRPEIAISFAFKNGEEGKVICDILLGRRGYISKNCCCIVGYVKTSDSIELDINNKDNAKIIADYCNKANIKVQKLVEKHPSLLRILPLGEKFELK